MRVCMPDGPNFLRKRGDICEKRKVGRGQRSREREVGRE